MEDVVMIRFGDPIVPVEWICAYCDAINTTCLVVVNPAEVQCWQCLKKDVLKTFIDEEKSK
jgi:hypothetical protein